MKSDAVTGALTALLLSAALAGCAEDVGDCPETGSMGRDTVINGNHVEFGGQAIMNRACATGCHSSTAKGSVRQGAPAGLDFDLIPVSGAGRDAGENKTGREIALLTQAEINGLRSRQRKVFSERNRIWQQVRDGLMPPDGVGEVFRAAIESIIDTTDSSPCTRGAPLKDIENKSSQDVLRIWLACQAPIVEAYGGPVEADGTGGNAGYQYLACENGGGDGGVGDGGVPVAVTLPDLFNGLFMEASCTACHPALARDYPLDLSTLATATQTLLSTEERCNGKPYVTPGDPDKSFLIDVVTMDDPGCGIERMPQTPFPELTESEVQEIRDWITAGAPTTAALISPPISGGLDAGVN